MYRNGGSEFGHKSKRATCSRHSVACHIEDAANPALARNYRFIGLSRLCNGGELFVRIVSEYVEWEAHWSL